jgi:16S rRNA (guanine966-N2)-methyltransferase
MRVTGGTVKGRRLIAVKGPHIRPTADMVRNSIFNILGQKLSGLAVLDLFAGTGSLGIECLSRGAKGAVFMDNSRRAVAIIKKNLTICGLEELSMVIREELPKGLTKIGNLGCGQFDLVFLDPPYGRGYIEPTMNELVESSLLSQDATVVAESSTSASDSLPRKIPHLQLQQTRCYGSTVIGFYSSHEGL